MLNLRFITKKSYLADSRIDSKQSAQKAPLPKSSKDLNIQMLETHNQIQNIEKVITKLKESLKRNKNA
jgi:hypothetical protein